MSLNSVALKAEILNDPRGYGYAPFVNLNDNAIAELLNRARDGAVGNIPSSPTADSGQASGIITTPRVNVTAQEILGVIDIRDLIGTANNLQASWFESVTQSSQPLRLANNDGTKSFIRQNIDRAVNNTQGSQARLDVLAVEVGSRFKELSFRNVWGVFTVSANDVGVALRNTP